MHTAVSIAGTAAPSVTINPLLSSPCLPVSSIDLSCPTSLETKVRDFELRGEKRPRSRSVGGLRTFKRQGLLDNVADSCTNACRFAHNHGDHSHTPCPRWPLVTAATTTTMAMPATVVSRACSIAAIHGTAASARSCTRRNDAVSRYACSDTRCFANT